MMEVSEKTAEILLRIEAVKVQAKHPFKFTSGLISPIYIDNRLVISFPEEREKIVSYLAETIEKNKLRFDVLAGVATAGIHWTAWLAARYNKPMVYIRDKAKSHGRQNQIEGLFSKGQKVLVIEDHVSTGESSVNAVKAVREAGGIVDCCLAITTYEFPEADKLFFEEECRLFTLTNFTSIINKAAELGYIAGEEKIIVLQWNKDSANWGKKHGFA